MSQHRHTVPLDLRDPSMRMDDDGEDERPHRGADGWSQHGWNWWGSDWSEWQAGSWKSDEYAPPTSWQAEVSDFIPDHLTGFLLLQRSGLDAGERANVLAAIRGEFSVTSVERALKEQWADDDLLKRDKSHYQAHFAQRTWKTA